MKNFKLCNKINVLFLVFLKYLIFSNNLMETILLWGLCSPLLCTVLLPGGYSHIVWVGVCRWVRK